MRGLIKVFKDYRSKPISVLNPWFLFLAAIFFALLVSVQGGPFLPRLLFPICLFLAIWVAILITNRIKENKRRMQSFALKNNLSFVDKIDLRNKEKNCQLLEIGATQISNYLKGSYKGRNVEVYNYNQVIGYGDNSRAYQYTVFETKTSRQLPTSIIAHSIGYLFSSQVNINFFKSEKLKTESNEFNRIFKIYLKKDNQIEDELKFLEIFTPEIMAKLIDEENKIADKDVNVEMRGNSLMVYKNDFVKTEEDLQSLLDLTIKLAETCEK